jgi:hypothetical protein
MCYSPLYCGTNLTFQEKLLLAPRDKTAKLAKCSEKHFKKTTIQKDYPYEGTSPYPDGVNYVRPLKVTKAKSF